ncbi:MAG: hypothetical protein JXR76_02355 [Deltaproteobacteria bacterium]|nr:hypothetical protein [Deltaproteobacteria bacterium]
MVRRPSLALAHLQELAESNPENGEAWCRLGNAQEQFGQLPNAEISWRKALIVSPADMKAVCSLAGAHAKRDEWPEAARFIRTGLASFPKNKDLDKDTLFTQTRNLLGLLAESLNITDEPLALYVAWRQGETIKKEPVLSVSSIDLRKVPVWDDLAESMVNEEIVAIDLISSLPDDDIPTILESRLAGRGNFDDYKTQQIIRPAQVVHSTPQSI